MGDVKNGDMTNDPCTLQIASSATCCSLFGSSPVSKIHASASWRASRQLNREIMGQLDGNKCEERPLSPTGRTHSKKMAEPLGMTILSKHKRGDLYMGLSMALIWFMLVRFKVSVWLFFSRMCSKGFSFYFGGLGVGTCSLHVAFTTASVRKRQQAPATVRNCSR